MTGPLTGARPPGAAGGVRTSLREQVANAVRSALVSGEMRPGVVYSVPGLASRFGVSATPVREALLDLAKEGLVEAVRNKGFRVTSLSEQDLDEIFELRSLLEVPGVARLAVTADPVQLDRLRPLADAIVAAAREQQLLAYLEADRRFHLALLELIDNRRLLAIVRNLRAQARLHGPRPVASRGELTAAAQDHHELLDLLTGRDAAGAAKVMRRHLERAGGRPLR
jgi:DNA-binding GntR family transcriptional regulator